MKTSKSLCVVIVILLVLSVITPALSESGTIKERSSAEKRWVRVFGGRGFEWSTCIRQTSDGGYILAIGTTSYGLGNWNAWLIKLNENGEKVWDKFYGGIGYDFLFHVEQTSDGGYILTGVTESYGAGKRDVWLIKVDENGNEIWNKTFGGEKIDAGSWIQQTSDGGYIIAGITESYGPGKWNGWIIKTDGNGSEIWNETFGKANAEAGLNCVIETIDGDYVAVGYITNKKSDSDIWLIKLDKDGSEVWNKTFNRGWQDDSYTVQQTADGGYMIFGNGGDEDNLSAWIIKTDKDGNREWNRTLCDEKTAYANIMYAGYRTTDNECVAVGLKLVKTWLMRIPWVGDIIVSNIFVPLRFILHMKGWIVKLDGNGNREWERAFAPIGYYMQCGDIQQTRDGGYIAVFTIYPFSFLGTDVVVVKMDSKGRTNLMQLETCGITHWFKTHLGAYAW